MKKRTKNRITLGAIAVALIAIVIVYNYNLDQTRLRGQAFGDELAQIQDDLKAAQTGFDILKADLRDGLIDEAEFLAGSSDHVEQMEDIASRYDFLAPPAGFESAVELLELSTVTQLEADRHEIELVRTGDESHRTRSDALYQEAFEYEIAGLAAFESAKAGIRP